MVIIPVCVRMCLLRELIHGKARGQYGHRNLCGESAYELRLRFMTHKSLGISVSFSADDNVSPCGLDDKPPSELELDSTCSQQQPANTDKCNISKRIYILRHTGKMKTTILFRSYCFCFHNIGLWCKYSSTVYKRIEACYNKCIKSFFKYRRLDSVTGMLNELGLSPFDSLFHDYVNKCNLQWLMASNEATKHFISFAL